MSPHLISVWYALDGSDLLMISSTVVTFPTTFKICAFTVSHPAVAKKKGGGTPKCPFHRSHAPLFSHSMLPSLSRSTRCAYLATCLACWASRFLILPLSRYLPIVFSLSCLPLAVLFSSFPFLAILHGAYNFWRHRHSMPLIYRSPAAGMFCSF